MSARMRVRLGTSNGL
ncbi:hypothetical protein MTR67_047721 [Solanum verrucosum]|nr:hypothetical protein MTR67_038862 [Solanum verrucosum]WMV54261.1 hypothetical protein MTR67_047646 [Solanum verrucosum]WMV54336.1 hypothetical protein MTR67_047721 [Solanum verrucosum]